MISNTNETVEGKVFQFVHNVKNILKLKIGISFWWKQILDVPRFSTII